MIFFNPAHIDPIKHSFIDPRLLWEYDVSIFDYQKMKSTVVQRVIERGDINDFYAILNIYGLESVIDTIKNLTYLNNKDLNFVHKIFEIPLEELQCFKSKQLKKTHWTS